MKYVFIVGLPRTGTKLVRNVLQSSRHAHCRISPEIWFFGDLFRSGLRRIIRKCGDMSDDRNVHKFLEYLYSGKFQRTYCKQLYKGGLNFDRELLQREILQSDRSDRAIYTTLMVASAKADPAWPDADEHIIGDKMPGNLYYVPTLIEWFPDAKIIHTFRDPRAIMASEWRRLVEEGQKGWRSKITNSFRSVLVVLYVTITWLYAVKLHHRYSRSYPQNYYLSKYEDLVEESEKSVARLCDFIGIESDEEMLSPAKLGSSFVQRSGAGFDTKAINRWQQHLKPWMRVWLSFWSGRYLKEFGYRL